MDIQTIGAWGELLGGISGLVAAVGVILTLLYLATQIRQNSRSVQASTELEMLSAWNQLGALRSESPDLMSIYDRGRDGYENLDEHEVRRFEMLCFPQFNIYQALYHQHIRGVLTKDVWEAQERNLVPALNGPGIRSWLEKNLPRYSDSFTGYLAELLAEQADK